MARPKYTPEGERIEGPIIPEAFEFVDPERVREKLYSRENLTRERTAMGDFLPKGVSPEAIVANKIKEQLWAGRDFPRLGASLARGSNHLMGIIRNMMDNPDCIAAEDIDICLKAIVDPLKDLKEKVEQASGSIDRTAAVESSLNAIGERLKGLEKEIQRMSPEGQEQARQASEQLRQFVNEIKENSK